MDEKANRTYKDGVFRLLFNDEANAAELYSAISGTSYTADAITMTTLQNPLFYNSVRNDASFTIEDKYIVLLEHQSTISPNMPIRFLRYVADIYKNLVDKKGIYKKIPLSIETPHFIVLYNGTDVYPEQATIKLSDLFKVNDSREPALEVIVTVYNVNHGLNKNIMAQSKTLNGYAAFIAKAREYESNGLNSTKSLQKAVEYCITNNILREFMEKNGGEIVSILDMEWNLDEALQVSKEEGAEIKAEKIAKKMLKRGTAIDIIIEDTELTEIRILELKKELKI